MTNGEKIKEVFPNMECEVKDHTILTNIDNGVWFSLDWWNAEYKEPTDKIDCDNVDCNNCVNHKYCDYESNKSEIPTSSTSSDCVDKHSVDLLVYRYLREPTDNHVAFYEDFLDLPPVTPVTPEGRWIREKSVHGWDGRSYQCSVCGRSIHLDTAVESLVDYPYCNCGSRNMR